MPNPNDTLEQFNESERPAFDIAKLSLKVWENMHHELDLIEADNLEQFIQRDRATFDTGIPSFEAWSNGLSPEEKFSRSFQRSDRLMNIPAWGCPAYVLQPALQDGKKLSKWKP